MWNKICLRRKWIQILRLIEMYRRAAYTVLTHRREKIKLMNCRDDCETKTNITDSISCVTLTINIVIDKLNFGHSLCLCSSYVFQNLEAIFYLIIEASFTMYHISNIFQMYILIYHMLLKINNINPILYCYS